MARKADTADGGFARVKEATGAPAAVGQACRVKGKAAPETISPEELAAFAERVRRRGEELYRDLPWRDTHEPFAVLVSEVMLQQTQVRRVLGRWERWMELFPTPAALAAAPVQAVLEQWQGMGYNRRALALHRAARAICERHGGQVPSGREELLALPGVGPATAAGVRVFAFGIFDLYIETNVRAVFIHELFPDDESVSDARIAPLVEASCPADASCRAWYYALLDYGAHLKATGVNPTRRAKAYTRQSRFEGSRRQKRAYLLRCVLDGTGELGELVADLGQAEARAGREAPAEDEVAGILADLEREGFLMRLPDGSWAPAE